jgi:hypothetical protein
VCDSYFLLVMASDLCTNYISCIAVEEAPSIQEAPAVAEIPEVPAQGIEVDPKAKYAIVGKT